MTHYPTVAVWDSEECRLMRDRFAEKNDLPISNPGRYPIKILTGFPVIISFGKSVSTPMNTLRINPWEGIANSIDKHKAKELWSGVGLESFMTKSALVKEFITDDVFHLRTFNGKFEGVRQFLLKSRKRSSGEGMVLCPDLDSLLREVFERHLANTAFKDEYLIEEFIPFDAEYRLHISPWLSSTNLKLKIVFSNMETGASLPFRYYKPIPGLIWIVKKYITAADVATYNSDAVNFSHTVDLTYAQQKSLVEACVTAAKAQGLDFAAYDVIRSDSNMYILESNSNPSLTNAPHLQAIPVEQQAYCQALPYIIRNKAKQDARFKDQQIQLL